MKCPICATAGSPWFKLHDLSGAVPRGVEFQIDRCKACECSYQEPMPSPEMLTQAYSGTYYAYEESPRIPPHVEPMGKWTWWEYFMPFFRRDHFHLLREELMWAGAEPETVRTILDVGCGSGHYTVAAARLFPQSQVVGQDRFLENCQPERAPNARYVRSLEDCGKEGLLFDLILMRNVIEHFTNPADVFDQLAKVSHAKTRIFIQTPNLQSVDRWLFGKLWFGFEVPRHTIVFSIKSLAVFAANQKWKVARRRTHFFPSAWLYFLSLDSVGRFYLGRPVPKKLWKILILPTTLLSIASAPFQRGGQIDAVLQRP